MKFKIIKYNDKGLTRADQILPKVRNPNERIDKRSVKFVEKGHYEVIIPRKMK